MVIGQDKILNEKYCRWFSPYTERRSPCWRKQRRTYPGRWRRGSRSPWRRDLLRFLRYLIIMQTCRESLGCYRTLLDRWKSQSSWMLRSLRWKVIWSSLKIPWSRKKSRRRAIFRNQGWNDFYRTLDTIYVSFCIVLCFLWWCQMFVLFKRLLCYNQKIWFSVQNHKKKQN